MKDVIAWYLHGIKSDEIPDSLDALQEIAAKSELDPERLIQTAKWDFLIREGVTEATRGFVPLSRLASTKRGIATGANEFFHLSAALAAEKKLPTHTLIPCVGRAADVPGLDFNDGNFDSLVTDGRRTFLVTFGPQLTPAERSYISEGEAGKLHERYLLAVRKPWYSMETQRPAPIWAAVFGRRSLRFIRNRTRALTLTTFHCVYPSDQSDTSVSALTLCLNAPSVQAAARAHTRVYGGGLLKFEPKDLLEIQVPDLRMVSAATLAALAAEQERIAGVLRVGSDYESIEWTRAEQLVKAAAHEAAQAQSPAELLETHPHQASHRHQLDAQTHHGVPGDSFGARLRKSGSRRSSLPASPTLWES